MNLIYKIIFILNIIMVQITIFDINSMNEKSTPYFKEEILARVQEVGLPTWQSYRTLYVNGKQTIGIKDPLCYPIVLNKNIKLTPLMHAILKDSKKDIAKLIKQGKDVNEKIDGISPLALAIYIGNMQVIKLLLNSGADITQDILIYANQASKEILDLLETLLKKKITTIKKQLKHGLEIDDLQNICLNYLDISKEMLENK